LDDSVEHVSHAAFSLEDFPAPGSVGLSAARSSHRVQADCRVSVPSTSHRIG
jgi:hypothetical protein